MKRFLFFLIFIITVIGNIYAEDVKFYVSAPSTVGSGQQFAVTFTVNAAATNLKAPSFKGFSVLSGPNQSSSSSMQIINGRMSQSVSYSFTYYLQAGNEGNYPISPAKITVDGKTYETESFTIKVVKSSANAGNQQQQSQSQQQQGNQQAGGNISDKDLFLKASVSNASPYLGEQTFE